MKRAKIALAVQVPLKESCPSHSHTISLTHTLFLSFSLTHTLSLSFSLSPRTHRIYVSLSLSLSHTHTHTLNLHVPLEEFVGLRGPARVMVQSALSLLHTTHSDKGTHSLACTHTHTHTLSLSLSRSLSHTFSLHPQVPLEEFVGLRGPARVMVENALTALLSNSLCIAV